MVGIKCKDCEILYNEYNLLMIKFIGFMVF